MRLRSSSAGASPATTPQEVAALRAIYDRAAPTRAELLALVDSLALPGSDDRFTADAGARLGAMQSRVHAARVQAASVKRRSDLRLRLISFLSDTETLLATLAELGTAPEAARVAALRSRASSLHVRLGATDRQLRPRLFSVKARKP